MLGIKPSEGNEDLPGFEKLSSVPISMRTPEERSADVNKALDWLRNCKQDSDDASGDFKRIGQLLPKKKNQTKERVTVHIALY